MSPLTSFKFRFLRTIGCDKRWMVVMCPGYEPHPELVRHYFGDPSWGWETFDMFGPFESREEAQKFCDESI